MCEMPEALRLNQTYASLLSDHEDNTASTKAVLQDVLPGGVNQAAARQLATPTNRPKDRSLGIFSCPKPTSFRLLDDGKQEAKANLLQGLEQLAGRLSETRQRAPKEVTLVAELLTANASHLSEAIDKKVNDFDVLEKIRNNFDVLVTLVLALSEKNFKTPSVKLDFRKMLDANEDLRHKVRQQEQVIQELLAREASVKALIEKFPTELLEGCEAMGKVSHGQEKHGGTSGEQVVQAGKAQWQHQRSNSSLNFKHFRQKTSVKPATKQGNPAAAAAGGATGFFTKFKRKSNSFFNEGVAQAGIRPTVTAMAKENQGKLSIKEGLSPQVPFGAAGKPHKGL